MAKVAIEDLSGASTPVRANPYDGLIEAASNNPKLIQDRYQQHRVARNAQQKAKILAEDFPGWILDEILIKLDGPLRDPEFQDPRNCLTFWARPPRKVKRLIDVVQAKLRDAAPGIWIMPPDNTHMTTIEVTHSLTSSEIEHLVSILHPSQETIADFPLTHKARLVKPMLSFDAAALALSFVPAAGEALPQGRTSDDDIYTYHHLRRDVSTKITDAGVKIASRYVVPSAHITVARINTQNPFGGDPLDRATGLDIVNRKRWIREIEMINKWLEAEYWPAEDGGAIMPGGEWIIGEEKSLDFRKGTLWYGGGETVYLGKVLRMNTTYDPGARINRGCDFRIDLDKVEAYFDILPRVTYTQIAPIPEGSNQWR